VTRFSPLASPTATRAFLEQWGLYTKKSLGQHFLIDDGVVGRILACAEVGSSDCIVEVGPGIGTLTAALLAQGAKVCAIEKDQRLLEPLTTSFEHEPNFSLVAADALDLAAVAKGLSAAFAADATASAQQQGEPTLALKLVANLPYAVAATIVLGYFEKLPLLQSATVMVQREVAERMSAQPNTKDYGAYTVKLGALAKATSSFAVARNNFMPPPRVDSTVIRLDRCATAKTSQSPAQESYQNFAFVVDAAFAQRRKTIRNSMCAYFSAHNQNPNLADELLKSADIDPKRRGETLTQEEFVQLAKGFTFFSAT